MSQTDLAKQLGLTFQQVQKYERGLNRIGAGRLAKVADLLQVPVTRLLGQYEDEDVTRTGPGGSRSPLALLTTPRRAAVAPSICPDQRRQATPHARDTARKDRISNCRLRSETDGSRVGVEPRVHWRGVHDGGPPGLALTNNDAIH